jgi:CBS domain-containing protein
VIHSTIASIIKLRPLAVAEAGDTLRDACQVMCELDVRAVVVTQDRKLVGVLSERDVIQQCVCPGKRTAEMQVRDAMTTEPKTLEDKDSLAAAIEVMSEGHFHHLPIMRNGEVVGLLTSDDIPEEYRMLLERFKEIRDG